MQTEVLLVASPISTIHQSLRECESIFNSYFLEPTIMKHTIPEMIDFEYIEMYPKNNRMRICYKIVIQGANWYTQKIHKIYNKQLQIRTRRIFMKA